LENEIEETEIEQFKIVQKKQSIRLVQSMLNRLGNRDRQIIKLRFGIGKEDKKTLEEIGKL